MAHARTSRTRRVVAFLAAACCVLVADQATKAWVRSALELGGERKVLLPGVMDLLWVENTGAAFSIGEGAGGVFVVIALAVFAVLLALVLRERTMPVWLAALLGTVAGGGVGNMVDRLVKGSVTDFLATSFIDFPVFNVADIFVTCGIVIVFVAFLRMDDEEDDADGGADADATTGEASQAGEKS